MKGLILAALVCRALDAGSSIAAFHAGSHEVIPWMPERPALVVTVHVGIGVAQTRALHQVATVKPTRAKVLAAVATGYECAVAAGNVRRTR